MQGKGAAAGPVGETGVATRVVTFLSDFGLADEFVGIVHSVLAHLAPDVRVVDLTHGIPAHDVVAGADLLERTLPWLCPGVVVAVVDPGVGGSRRPVALQLAGRSDLALVGPDNGLLWPAAVASGGVTQAVLLDRGAVRATVGDAVEASGPPESGAGAGGGSGSRQGPGAGPGAPPALGATFDGRDLFAPAGAALARGLPLESLGPQLDPDSLVHLPRPASSWQDGTLVADVASVDRFGNVQLAAGREELEMIGSSGRVRSPGGSFDALVARSFDALPTEELGIVLDSWGRMALVRNCASAAALLGLRRGDVVRLEPGDPAQIDTGSAGE